MNIIDLTDEELCMLEQLTYLNENVSEIAGIQKDFFRINSENKGDSISDILSDFDDVALDKLRLHTEPIDGFEISGLEWANIIEYLKNPDNRISQLVLTDIMFNNDNFNTYIEKENKETNEKEYISIKNDVISDELRKKVIENNLQTLKYNTKTEKYYSPDELVGLLPNPDDFIDVEIYRLPLALCFTDGTQGTNEAIIAYKGTSGPNEWADNVHGAYSVQTQRQLEALDFAERMVREHNYTELTVTGHSKGANKAMYTTIMCNNVTRCVTFDGQGFSREFMSDPDILPRILKRADLITQYSLSTDFVHILLNQLPGSNQIYCKGYGVDGIGENHSPNSFFVQNQRCDITDKKDLYMFDYQLDETEFNNPDVYNTKLNVINKYNIGEIKKQTLSDSDESIPSFDIELERYSVHILNELIHQIISRGSKDLLPYVESWLPLCFDGSGSDEIMDAIFADIPHFSELLGNIMYYMNKNDLDYDYIISLITDFTASMPMTSKDLLVSVVDNVFKAPAIVTTLLELCVTTSMADFFNHKFIDDLILNNVEKGSKPDIFSLFDKDKNDSIKDDLTTWGLVTLSPVIPGEAQVVDVILDKIGDSDLIKKIRNTYDKIWYGVQDTCYKLSRPYYGILDSEYLKNNADFKECFEEYFVDSIAKFFLHNQELLDGTGVNSINQLIDGLINRPISIINTLSYDKNVSIIIDAFFNSFIDKISQKTGYSWRFETKDNDVVYNYGNPNKVVFTGKGDDFIYSKSKNSIIIGGEGNDTIIAGSGTNELYGDSGEDTIYGGTENDRIYGGLDKDTIDGGSGDDWIYGGEGNDTIIAGSGNDHVWGENGADTINGSGGRNSLFGGQGNDTITGGINSDLIWGEEDNDTLEGNYGNDEIFGGVGEDTIDGGYGIDYLYGGRGNDTYIIAKDRLQNYIYDPYGYNHLSFIDLALSDIEMTLSETLNDALDIKIKNTNDVFTIMDFSESYKSFGLEFEDESSSFGKVYYNFTYTNGVVGLDELTGENLYYASTSIGLDRMWRKVNNNAKTHNANNFNHAQNVQPPRDPLVIDFSNKETSSNEGLVNADNGVYFDLDNNGFAEKTAWIDNGKGFLAYDRNGNGVIDNGSELFGDNVIMSNGEKSAHGFEALADLDSNNDGIIDKKDAEFNNLLVWQDTQRNGKTDSGELKTLEQLGIESISLTTENKNHTTESGIIVTDSAEVRFKNNSTTDIAEHWFEAHGYDTQELNVEGDGVSLTSFGNMPSLSNALAADSSGELNALIERYRNTVIFAEKKMLVKKILFFVTGANAIASNSRGGNIDAKKLHVIETIMGVNSFIGVDGNSVPNNTAVPILNDLYTQFENLYLTLLDEEFNETEYIKYLDEKINENGNIVIDSEYIDIAIDNSVQHGNNIEYMILSIGSYIKAYDKACGTNCFESFKEKYSEYLENLEEIIETDSVLGTQGNDKLNGTNKSDIFFGDAGNDTLDGGSGNDTYIFNLGDGNDTIIESDSSKDIDSIVFGEGISAEDITISREGDDMILTVGNKGDSIRIVRYYDICYSRNYRIEQFVFADGTIKTFDEYENATLTIRGSGVIKDFEGGAGTRNSYIIGSDEDDTINAYEGDDTLIGGKGNDTLNGGSGNDTYIFNLGDGNDTIIESDSSKDIDSIVFGEGISAEDITISREGDDMILTVGNKGDSIRIVRYYDICYSRNYRIEQFVFADGTIKTFDEYENATLTIRGSGTINDYESGAGTRDSIIYGSDINDTINAYAGNDTLIGGKGDDTLNGGSGNDTYIFNLGDGNDTIIESDSSKDIDSIIFGEGITADDITISREGDDMILTVGNEGDSIRIVRYYDICYSRNYRIEQFVFADGTIKTFDEYENATLTIRGSGVIKDFEGGAGTRNSYIIGSDEDDTINAYEGDDTLIGGKGNDTLDGGSGNDTYIFNLGDGNDTIIETNSSNSNDKIIFGEGITADDITISREGDDMILTVGNEGDSIRIVRYYDIGYSRNYRIEQFVFADGTIKTFDEYENATLTIRGSGVIKDFEGGAGTRNSYIIGSDEDDTIYAYSGDDTLIGGKGNDTLDGGSGNDNYIFNLGDGNDTIIESDSSKDIDSIVFGEGISAEDITISREGDDMILTVGNEGDSIRIVRYYDIGYSRNYRIEQFVFADGTVKTSDDFENATLTIRGSGTINDYESGAGTRDSIIYGSDINDTINAYAGNDTLIGGKGDDTLNGGSGNDTYIFNLGDGNDTIIESDSSKDIDSIVFGEGISAEDITISREGDDMILTVGNEGDSIRIVRYYDICYSRNYRIEQFVFADGTIKTFDEYENATLTIRGSGVIKDFEGGAGTRNSYIIGSDEDDTINAYEGDDTLIGGKGNDTLDGGSGNDTYIFNLGDGNDTIIESDSSKDIDSMVFGEGISAEDITISREGDDMILTVGNEGDSIRIVRYYDICYSRNYRIEQFVFADGTIKTFDEYENATLTIRGSGVIKDFEGGAGTRNSYIIGSDEDDTINAYEGDDTLIGGKGNDTLDGGSGNDTYIFNLGDGNDTIIESDSSKDIDSMVFGEGISAEDITISREGDDMILTVGNEGDSIRIVRYYDICYSRNYRIEQFVFADGTIKTFDEYENATLTIRGSGVIKDFEGGAGTRNSYIIGSDEDDTINAYEGDDTLIGGKGNDTLDGGSGNDTYIFNLGDGNDTIIESDSSKDIDSIVFGEGISAEDITISREGDDMILTVGNEGDSIRIVRYYHKDYGRNYRIENFIFKDGSEGYIDINTSVLILTKQPDPVEEDIEQTNAELLNEIYSDDEIGADIFENDSTIISEVTDSITVSDDTDEVSDMTDIQTMILAENMSAFSDDSNVYDNTNITDITADTSALDQLIVSSVQ